MQSCFNPYTLDGRGGFAIGGDRETFDKTCPHYWLLLLVMALPPIHYVFKNGWSGSKKLLNSKNDDEAPNGVCRYIVTCRWETYHL
jgi:hypothetical protein